MSAAEQLKAPPSYIACLIDWSDGCSEEFLKRCGGKVFVTGFFDDSVDHHLCSPQKHIYFHGLGLEPEKYPEGEKGRQTLYDELLEGWHEACLNDADKGYHLRRDIERLRETHPERFVEVHIEFDDPQDEDECEREVREHLTGNPVF